jgi:tetratricopeptide (TPR) repeat protein
MADRCSKVASRSATSPMTIINIPNSCGPIKPVLSTVRYAYVYAVALNSAGRRDDAIDTLKESLTRHPNDRDTLMALISYYRDAGKLESALQYAEQLGRISPNDLATGNLISTLREQLKKSTVR